MLHATQTLKQFPSQQMQHEVSCIQKVNLLTTLQHENQIQQVHPMLLVVQLTYAVV